MRAGEVVDAMLAASAAMDLDAIVATLADDIVYENVPLGVNNGRDAAREWLDKQYIQIVERAVYEVLRQVEQGDVVMNERIDHFWMKDGQEMHLRIAGVFAVRDGKIAVWRDYFDSAAPLSQLGYLEV